MSASPQKHIAAGLALLLGLLLVITVNITEEDTAEDGILTYFTDFSLSLFGGGTFSAPELKETAVTVVNVFSTDCVPCIKEMPLLEALADAYANVRVLGLASDWEDSDRYREKLSGILSEAGVTYPVLIPDEAFFEKAYPLLHDCLPGTFFLDSKGRLLHFVSGALTAESWELTVRTLLLGGKP